MNFDDVPDGLEEAWIHYERADLQRRYGIGNFIAVYENIVVDWDRDCEALRERAERNLGSRVFVGPVPIEPPPPPGEWETDASRRIDAIRMSRPNRRLLRLNVRRHYEIGDLIGSRGCELLDGIVYIDGLERRYAEHDYRLLVEHGLIPKETILVGGIIFWEMPRNEISDTAWIEDLNAENRQR